MPYALKMDTSSEGQPDLSAVRMDVSAAPGQQQGGQQERGQQEGLVRLRALEPGGAERFGVLLTPDAAVQVQAVLRLEEGDSALDLLFPPDAPTQGMRLENLPDTGSRFARLNVDSRLPEGEWAELSADEAAELAERIEAALQARQPGEEGGPDSSAAGADGAP